MSGYFVSHVLIFYLNISSGFEHFTGGFLQVVSEELAITAPKRMGQDRITTVFRLQGGTGDNENQHHSPGRLSALCSKLEAVVTVYILIIALPPIVELWP